MKRILSILILLPFLLNGQDTIITNSDPVQDYISLSNKRDRPMPKKHHLSTTSYLTVESDDLNSSFLNSMLFGGFITDEMKDKWINSGDESNQINAEITNGIRYQYTTYNLNSYYFQFSDVNLINSSFSDDLLKLTFHGNYDYQGDTLDFSNTVIRADRYQQYKVGYGYSKWIKTDYLKISTALSYLVGNHHAQLNINKGSLYTAEMGTYLDVNYDINAMITDTSNLSPFAGNGKGMALDFVLSYTKDYNTFGIHIRDLGYINWNKSSIIANTDSSFNFTGIEVNDFNSLPEFNDSIMDISFSQNTSSFRSFIPARITLSYSKILEHKYFNSISIFSHSRWQPYQVKGGLNWDLFHRGFKESGYTTSLDVSSNIDLKYINSTIGFSVGGFTDGTKILLTLSDKKGIFTIGTYHLNELFKKDKTSLSAFIQLQTRF